MQDRRVLKFVKEVLENLPQGWLDITTHRLDIYNESKAKTEFLEQFEDLFAAGQSGAESLCQLPTAYDYIRLGHQLSSVLEWTLGKIKGIPSEQVISFASQTAPILAILRFNHLNGKKTRLIFDAEVPAFFDQERIKSIYGYDFETLVGDADEVNDRFDGISVSLSRKRDPMTIIEQPTADFYIDFCGDLGSVLSIYHKDADAYVSAIQHVRRRETIAMTPQDTFYLLDAMINGAQISAQDHDQLEADKQEVFTYLKDLMQVDTQPMVGSSGLSIQYAIMMGLIEHAQLAHQGKPVKFIVPTNCYGGTNDQARRVAACLPHVEIVDLHVDGQNDMVSGLRRILEQLAQDDAVPFIIAEIPTNPRVEVPDLGELESVLRQKRTTASGQSAVQPVFILDQTFCPNVAFMKEGELLSAVKAISYASGSKFPSGGKCTAGYAMVNRVADDLGPLIQQHLILCDNEATALQYHLLAEQLPSMKNRIKEAYLHTREFVEFIKNTLPEAKINFVSEELAARGFTPSVFSLDLPTSGATPEEREARKRQLNLQLIHAMIEEIPEESKFCVSYGQLKGVYWTVPATSTQGTTQEKDKDYIVRASFSPDLDMEKHKQVFREFALNV
ncbi:PLP-dependent aminotransferase family protein [Nonlabens xiamenensis]|uniref:cystathionine beta-synthase n=1 Tax=Nonlabens xiamenensis TaxID=2341043 RepID=UPI000F606E5C|nr:cystathionine beta-synthase [Nonlabens xiamenensis]